MQRLYYRVFSFLVNDVTLPSDNPLRFMKKMTFNEIIKTTDDKIQLNQSQYNLDRQSANILPLPTGNVCKYEFLTGTNCDCEFQYTNFLDEKKINKHFKHNFSNLLLDGYSHDDWFYNPNDKKSGDKNLEGQLIKL